MDKYEQFFDEYITFMNSCDSSDAGRLIRCMSMLAKYTRFMDEFKNMDESTMNYAELNYYTQVLLRVESKLLSAIG